MKKTKNTIVADAGASVSGAKHHKHDRVRAWTSVLIIIMSVLIIVIAAFWIIYTRHHDNSRLTDKDVEQVDKFFNENPPAQLTPQDFQYLQRALGDEQPPAPVKKSGKAK